MKNLFFIVFMTSVTALCALSAEQFFDQQDNSIGISQSHVSDDTTLELESRARCRRHHRHHHSSSRVVDGLAYGSFYTEGNGVELIIPPETIIPLRAVSTANNTFLNSNGTVSLLQPGDYFIEFGAAVITTGPALPTIALALNGVAPQPGSNINLPTTGQLTTASTILHVETPSILSLVNTGESFSLSPAGGVNAFISVNKLNSSN